MGTSFWFRLLDLRQLFQEYEQGVKEGLGVSEKQKSMQTCTCIRDPRTLMKVNILLNFQIRAVPCRMRFTVWYRIHIGIKRGEIDALI